MKTSPAKRAPARAAKATSAPAAVADTPSPTASSGQIRENVALLQRLLNEAIGYLDGPEGADIFKRALRAQPEDMHAFSTSEAIYAARAIACLATFSNISEDVVGRRRHSAARPKIEADRPRNLVAAIERLRGAADIDAQKLDALIGEMRAVPVLTAHPTEMRRRSVMEREYQLSDKLRERHEAEPARKAKLEEELFRFIAILWKTRLHRPDRIMVEDEITNNLAIVRHAILPALVKLYEDWSHALPHETATPLTLGAWIGGDRDGHPHVNDVTLRQALRFQSQLIIDYYIQEVDALGAELSISTSLAGVSEDVLELARRSHETLVSNADEPYRRALRLVRQRLLATRAFLADRYANEQPDAPHYPTPADFIYDVKTLRESLIANGGERLVGNRLRNLIRIARVCGFHLLAIDLRQNQDVHEQVIAELYARSPAAVDYLALSEEQRIELLLQQLAHVRPLRWPLADYSALVRKELAILDAAADAIGAYGPNVIGSYIISKASSVSDILETYVLMKQAGLVYGGAAPRALMRVAPLFETIGDLENAPDIMRAWFATPVADPLIQSMGGVQEIMLGYSDSNKDGGYAASRWCVHEAASTLADTCRNAGAAPQFFHGRGGTVGRGGGPSFSAVLAQPPGSVAGRMRLTEQGEMIARKYGDERAARDTLDSLAAAVLMASAEPNAAGRAPNAQFEKTMSTMAKASYQAYRALIDAPGFTNFFATATPISEIRDLKIGSRPASRSKSTRIEDLRAIPWVFSWSQARIMLPGWFGFAGGVDQAKPDLLALRDMVEEWPFFETLISNMEVALAQSDMNIASHYAALCPDKKLAKTIFGRIENEWKAARDLVLSIKNISSLLELQPDLADSVSLSRPFLEPLNFLQVEFLSRRRAGESGEQIQLGVQLTVNGIAAGLRNTG